MIWPTAKLSEVCEQERRSIRAGQRLDLPYIGMESIEAHTGRLSQGDLSKTPEAPEANSFHFDSSHVLYGKLRPYLNKVYVPESEGKCSTELIPLKPTDRLDRRFLAYFLRAATSVESISQKVAGARMPRADMDFVLSMHIPLPPLVEQRRIIDLLSRAENIVRMRREAEAKAKEIIPALFVDMFGDAGTNPKGWALKSLGETSRIVGGSSLPKGDAFCDQEGGDLLVKVSDMNRPGNEVHLLHSAEWAPHANRSSSRVPAGAIVLPKRGAAIATNKKRLTTRSSLLDPNLMGIIPNESIVLRRYLFQWFLQFDLATITSGTTVPQLNKGDLAPLAIPVPPQELQTQFSEQTTRIGAIVKAAGQATTVAGQAFQSLQEGVFRDRRAR
jgi:type I restriction enzyme S subunit